MSVYYWLCIRAIPKKRAMEVLTQLKYSNDLRFQQSWKSKKNFFLQHWHLHWLALVLTLALWEGGWVVCTVRCIYIDMTWLLGLCWSELTLGYCLCTADGCCCSSHWQSAGLSWSNTANTGCHCRAIFTLTSKLRSLVRILPSLSSTQAQNNSSPSVLCDRSTISRELFLEGQFPRIRF